MASLGQPSCKYLEVFESLDPRATSWKLVDMRYEIFSEPMAKWQHPNLRMYI